MSFQEKSAWVMALLMTSAGLYYLHIARVASTALGETASPIIAIALVILSIIGSVVVQVVLAISSLKEASTCPDERERQIQLRSSHLSGFVLAAGVVSSLGHFLAYSDGNMLFHLVMGSLIVSQIAEYAFQILLVRRSF